MSSSGHSSRDNEDEEASKRSNESFDRKQSEGTNVDEDIEAESDMDDETERHANLASAGGNSTIRTRTILTALLLFAIGTALGFFVILFLRGKDENNSQETNVPSVAPTLPPTMEGTTKKDIFEDFGQPTPSPTIVVTTTTLTNPPTLELDVPPTQPPTKVATTSPPSLPPIVALIANFTILPLLEYQKMTTVVNQNDADTMPVILDIAVPNDTATNKILYVQAITPSDSSVVLPPILGVPCPTTGILHSEESTVTPAWRIELDNVVPKTLSALVVSLCEQDVVTGVVYFLSSNDSLNLNNNNNNNNENETADAFFEIIQSGGSETNNDDMANNNNELFTFGPGVPGREQPGTIAFVASNEASAQRSLVETTTNTSKAAENDDMDGEINDGFYLVLPPSLEDNDTDLGRRRMTRNRANNGDFEEALLTTENEGCHQMFSFDTTTDYDDRVIAYSGIMFDLLTMRSDIEIQSLEIQVKLSEITNFTVEVFTTDGAYLSKISNEDAWKRVANVKAVPSPDGSSIIIPSDQFTPIRFGARQRLSVYIQMAGPWIYNQVHALVKTGEQASVSTDLVSHAGIGLAGRFPWSYETITDPQFAGKIHYRKAVPCTSSPTTQPTSSPTRMAPATLSPTKTSSDGQDETDNNAISLAVGDSCPVTRSLYLQPHEVIPLVTMFVLRGETNQTVYECRSSTVMSLFNFEYVLPQQPTETPSLSVNSPAPIFESAIPTFAPTNIDATGPEQGFVVSKPFDGTQTSSMDPYEKGDCFFGDRTFPHVFQQCQCLNNVTIVPSDVVDLWNLIRDEISMEFYNGDYDEPWWSCYSSNLALVWLSSGRTRDGGDLYQRFITALSFFELNGTAWDMAPGWLGDGSECQWMGIQCTESLQINSIALEANSLYGSIPSELAKLDGIRTLSLSRNSLTGTVPTELFAMPELENLSLYANKLRGSIPSRIANAHKLKSLLLANNLFFGTIVTEIGQATTLERLDIGFNEFWRKIPAQVGLLTNLKYLNMEDNRLSGSLLPELAQLSKLEECNLSRNLFSGTIPSAYGALTSLTDWRMTYAGIDGTLPKELSMLTNLVRLGLSGNRLYGTIMTEFGTMTSLSWLTVNGNDLTGSIPTEFGQLVQLTRLSLKDTLVSGSIPMQLGALTQLQELALSNTQLSDTMPGKICALRLIALTILVVDCQETLSSGEMAGVTCSVPDCCTFCRRARK